MRDLVPFVHTNEENKIKEELSKKFVSAIFDDTTSLGEAFAIMLQFVLKGKIVQQLVKLQMLAKPMNADELARKVIIVFCKLVMESPHISYWHACMTEYLLMVLPCEL